MPLSSSVPKRAPRPETPGPAPLLDGHSCDSAHCCTLDWTVRNNKEVTDF